MKIGIAIFSVAVFLLILTTCGSQLKPAPNLFEANMWEGKPLVQTKYGLIKGGEGEENTWVWKGIPYASPPMGELRWKAPRPPKPWLDILNAKSFSKQPIQHLPFLGMLAGSEDCLYLNIWRPKSKAVNLPVYLYVHGGGNSLGSANMVPDYYGHGVASKSGLVYVSINYRLGPLGWFTHPALKEGVTPEDASGNYGTLDIIQSLKWVKENIQAFGGDPNRVVIAGESAGAMNILSLLTSPLAKGLFSGAIIESGITTMASVEDGNKASHKLLIDLLVKDGKAANAEKAEQVLAGMSNTQIRDYLYSQNPGRIYESFKAGGIGMIAFPNIIKDGYVLPEEGYKAFETGVYPVKVPLIIGSNKEESKLFLSFNSKLDYKSDLYQAVAKYGSIRWKVQGVDDLAQKLTVQKDQPQVYVYRFDWGSINSNGTSPLPGDSGLKLGAFHSIEIPFFLGTDTVNGFFLTGRVFSDKNKIGRQALSKAIMRYLASFASTGNPNSDATKDLPEWIPWTNSEGKPKAIQFNVDADTPQFSYQTEPVTLDSMNREMKQSLDGPLLTNVLKLMNQDVRK